MGFWKKVLYGGTEKNTVHIIGSCVAFMLVLLVVSVVEAQTTKSVPKYRDLAIDDGLECHMYTEVIASPTGIFSGTLSAGGRSFECLDASGKSKTIRLVATRKLKSGKVAIVTKSFGTVYYRNDETCVASETEEGKPSKRCTENDKYEMTDIQIKNLKVFLGL